ncbi:MAG: NAD(P)/FAD-dependent oxidoreductase [Candidatus Dormibacteria bacterium]
MTETVWGKFAPDAPITSPLLGRLETEVCVVGLGGSGLAALSELTRRGVKSVGLDAAQIAAGAAGRNAGFLLAGLAGFHHDAIARFGHTRALACYQATQVALAQMASETPSSISVTGSLRIAADAAELVDCEHQFEAMRADGLAVEEWSGLEGDGLLFPGDGTLLPVQRCREMAQRYLTGGGHLYTGTRVLEIEPHRVRCASAEIRCEVILACVDGGLERLIPSLKGVVRSARLQMLATAPLAQVVTVRPVYRRFGYDYYQQLPTRELVLGGGRDRGGESEWTDKSTTTRSVRIALARWASTLTGAEASISHRWAGVVGYTQSGLPIVREVAPRVFAAGGYCGTGNVVGRIAGRALAELALDGSSPSAQLFDGPDGR